MKEILSKIVQSQSLEARWLHTISLLEYIGARKIAKTMCTGAQPELDVLEHYADECRHAFIFKKLAIHVNNDVAPGYLCQEDAVNYFQTLDHGLSKWLEEKTGAKNPLHSYLLTTSLIERRAMKIYPLYKTLTRQELVASELKQIIIEESNHKGPLDQKAQRVLEAIAPNLLEEAIQKEEELFEKFLGALSQSLEQASLLHH